MLKGAVIGFGRMGITHFAILNTHPSVKMAAVCDTSTFVVKNFQRHAGVRGFTDAHQMLDSVALDFVIIATPSPSHYQMISEALARGLHVFAEKPLTLAAIDSERLSDDATSAQLVNQVGYVNRFNEVFGAVKEVLTSGVLGEVHHFRCAMYAPTVLREPKGGWRGRRKTGGGCLLDFASHGIDLVHFMFGPPDRIAGSAIRNIYSRDAEDAVYSTLLYRGGLSGHLSFNWSDESYRKPAYRFEVEATNGRLSADQHAYKLYLRKPPSDSPYKCGWNVRYATDLSQPVRFYLRGNEFTRQLDYFIDKVCARDTSNINSFVSASATDKTIQAILNDAGIS
jgi:predicted dehydrogenase